ncbi:chorismate synthase [bacterium]|nr:chorismate synthase [bacterium]|tara:strand:+ start:2009 stop:3082 length:1074 start_codon:yes stop_codon:yes gene_type:complete
MAGNQFGSLFSVTTFGESHGEAIGAIVDGCPAGLPLTDADIQYDLDRRRPGQSHVTTPRKESDTIHIFSGVFNGKTTGAPIGLTIYNENQQSKDYTHLASVFRPGHADYTYTQKYKHRDHRGGGRSSGRETAARVAAGAIAKQWLRHHGIQIQAYTLAVGPFTVTDIDLSVIETNPIRCPNTQQAIAIEAYIEQLKHDGDSVGGIVQLCITGMPVGIGEPCFDKLDAVLGHAILSIGTIKGVEFGAGFKTAELLGSESNDTLQSNAHGISTTTNHAGGIVGGLSNGEPILVNAAVKAPSSIRKNQETVTRDGENTTLSVTGRHDPCICPRVVPVIEAMAALSIMDLMLINHGYSHGE